MRVAGGFHFIGVGAQCLIGLLLLGLQRPAAALTEDESNTVEVFKRASRGVVHIDARATLESRFNRKQKKGSTGTGFVIDEDGRILTSLHVIEGMNQIDVILNGGRRVGARLVGTSPQLDVALLRIEAPAAELSPLALGDSSGLQVGQKVIAIGNPFGLHNTLTVGVVSALRRTADAGPVELEDAFIQMDAAVNPGSSGGPLLNSSGEVVGISTALLEDAQNVGFAVPIHLVRRIIPDLIKMGHPYRPQIGFGGSAITPSMAKLFGLPLDLGFLVEEVFPSSPAMSAGLRAGDRTVVVGDRTYVLGGDIITAVNDRKVTSAAQIAQELMQSRPGQMLRLSIYRQGEMIEIRIPLRKMHLW